MVIGKYLEVLNDAEEIGEDSEASLELEVFERRAVVIVVTDVFIELAVDVEGEMSVRTPVEEIDKGVDDFEEKLEFLRFLQIVPRGHSLIELLRTVFSQLVVWSHGQGFSEQNVNQLGNYFIDLDLDDYLQFGALVAELLEHLDDTVVEELHVGESHWLEAVHALFF